MQISMTQVGWGIMVAGHPDGIFFIFSIYPIKIICNMSNLLIQDAYLSSSFQLYITTQPFK